MIDATIYSNYATNELEEIKVQSKFCENEKWML